MDVPIRGNPEAEARLRSRRRAQWTRRAAIGALTAGGGLGAISAGLYAIAPWFWKRYLNELRRPIAPAPNTPHPAGWPRTGLHAAWLGHSTVLLSIDGFTIITDPQFSNWAGVHFGPFALGVKRLVAPALQIRNLPKIDLILLSHAHMDHFDLPSLRRLENRSTAVITAAYTSDLLRASRYASVKELQWGESAGAGPARVTAFQVKHWGTRMRTDHHRGYNAYLVESGRWRVLFAGDTGYTDSFKAIGAASPVDVAILPIGCYNPWWPNHCTPEEAWLMSRDAGAGRIIPIHHHTFILSNEPLEEPIQRLEQAAGQAPERIALRRIGEEFHLAG